MAEQTPDDREQRIRETAARVTAEEPAEGTRATRNKREPRHPKVDAALDALGEVTDELDVLQAALKGEPVVAALVLSIRQRIHRAWMELTDD